MGDDAHQQPTGGKYIPSGGLDAVRAAATSGIAGIEEGVELASADHSDPPDAEKQTETAREPTENKSVRVGDEEKKT